MSNQSATSLRIALIALLREAEVADRGVVGPVESHVRDYARARREEGVAIEKTIVDVKALVREHVPRQEHLFMPRVVGWTVAGYFAGTSRRDQA